MKTYIKPSITIAVVETEGLIAASNTVGSVSGLEGVTQGDGDFGGGAADSRGGWFDDED